MKSEKENNHYIYNAYNMRYQDSCLCLVTVCCCDALNKTLSRRNLFLLVFTVVKY